VPHEEHAANLPTTGGCWVSLLIEKRIFQRASTEKTKPGGFGLCLKIPLLRSDNPYRGSPVPGKDGLFQGASSTNQRSTAMTIHRRNSTIFGAVFSILLISSSSWALAGDTHSLSSDEQYCYARSMVGMDSVINSRLGVQPERALEVTGFNVMVSNDQSTDQHVIGYLKVIYGAYLWTGSPHTYAQKVFYRCAVEQYLNGLQVTQQ